MFDAVSNIWWRINSKSILLNSTDKVAIPQSPSLSPIPITAATTTKYSNPIIDKNINTLTFYNISTDCTIIFNCGRNQSIKLINGINYMA